MDKQNSSKSQKKDKLPSSSNAGEKKKPPFGAMENKSLYERIVGKTPLTTAPIKTTQSQPTVKNKILSWFTKETAEERAIRNMLKVYRQKLQQELQYASSALTKYQRKSQDQIEEYEKQERQLITWGLKAAIPKFHLQAWYRIERCRLYEVLAEEIRSVLDARQKKTLTYLQNFEESSNRRTKFSLSSTEEFCVPPEKLSLQDASILSLQDRLKRMDILFGVASKQFMQLEPEFEWKDQKDRKKEFCRILYSYNDLPQYSELDNIESDLSWKSFCNWIADRNTKQKKIEQDYFDFIEDSREVEGRLFQRWQTCVLMSLTATGAHSVDRSTSDSSDQQFRETPVTSSVTGGDSNDFRNSRPAPLKVTAASIRAFIKYFATDIIGVKYTIPRECIAANKALAEALFYRRIAPFVFRYQDNYQRRMDDFWRMQCQRCRFVDPKAYYVIEKYLVKKDIPVTSNSNNTINDAPAPVVGSESSTTSMLAEEAGGSASGQTGSPTPSVSSSPMMSSSSTSTATRRERKGSQSGGNTVTSSSIHPVPCICYYCQTLSLSQRLQRLPVFEEEMRGKYFARSSRVLSWLRLAVTPREMATYLTLACKWILRDAIDVSGSRSIIGADEMVPLFTMILVHAQIPNIHMILRILTDFGEYDEQGDVSYCVANLEGSMRFLMDFTAEEIPLEVHQTFQQSAMYASIVQTVIGGIVGTLVNGNVGQPSLLNGTGGFSGFPPPSPLYQHTTTIGSIIGTQHVTGKSAGHQIDITSSTISRTVSPGQTLSTSTPSAAAVAVTSSEPNLEQEQLVFKPPNAITPLMMSGVADNDSTGKNLSSGSPSVPPSVVTTPYIISKPAPVRHLPETKKQEDKDAMEQLGEWLRDQKTMEDTIAILQSDGWML